MFIDTGNLSSALPLNLSLTYLPTDEVLEADEVLELQEGVEEGEDRLDLEGGRPQEVYSVFRLRVI